VSKCKAVLDSDKITDIRVRTKSKPTQGKSSETDVQRSSTRASATAGENRSK